MDSLYNKFGATIQDITDATNAADDLNSLMEKSSAAGAFDEDDINEELRIFLENDTVRTTPTRKEQARSRDIDAVLDPPVAQKVMSATDAYRRLGIIHSNS
jgi:hypothetical protein